MGADGSNQTILTDDGSSPTWSPDGKIIAFTTWSGGKHTINSISADGSNRTLISYEGGFGPRWSPDAKKIAFVYQIDGKWQIYVMNADGTNRSRITDSALGSWSPSWLPY